MVKLPAQRSRRDVARYAVCRMHMRPVAFILYLIGLVSGWAGVSAQVNESAGGRMNEDMIPVSTLSAEDSLRLKQLFDSSEVVRRMDPKRAEIMLSEALGISRQRQFAGGVAHALNGLAGIYTGQGKLEEAAVALRDAWPYCFLAGAQSNLLTVNWYNNMSSLFQKKGNADQAYRYLDVALQKVLRGQPADSGLLVMLYANIGSIWNNNNEPSRALYYLEKGRKIAEETGSADLVSIYNTIGLSYDRMGRYEEAKSYYYKAADMAEKDSELQVLRLVHMNLGNLYAVAGRTDSAIYLLLQSLDRDENLNTVPYFYLAKAYLLNEDYAPAEEYALRALKSIPSEGSTFYHSILNSMLAAIYSHSGQYQKALTHLERHMLLKDSLASKEKERVINDFDFKYRTSEKDRMLTGQRLLLLEKESRLQKKNRTLWGVTAVSALCVLIVVAVYKYRQKLQNERIGNLEKDVEIRRLHAIMEGEEQERSRIAHELHDGIVSQLTAVKLNFSSLLQQAQPDKALLEQGLSYLDETMQDLRKTAHNLMPETVLKKGLITSLNDFCLKMDNENATRIHFMTSGELPQLAPQTALSIYRMIQELVQNALKHARARNLLVQVNAQEDLLDVTVEDDGTGFRKEPQAREGSGLMHIRQRVAAMKGYIEFISSDTGLTVYAEIPLPARTAPDTN